MRREQLVPSPRAGATPRGCHSPFSTLDSATADALLIPDVRPALCRDVLLRLTWRSVGVRGFVRPGSVHNRRRESRGTRTRGRATAWSRAKGARMFRGREVCGASLRLATLPGGRHEKVPTVAITRSRASGLVRASLKVGTCPDRCIIQRSARKRQKMSKFKTGPLALGGFRGEENYASSESRSGPRPFDDGVTWGNALTKSVPGARKNLRDFGPGYLSGGAELLPRRWALGKKPGRG